MSALELRTLSHPTGKGNALFAVGARLLLSSDTYSSAGKIREIIKEAVTSAGQPTFGPHSFRKTLGILANDHSKTPEQFKARSVNLGHESIATSLSACCPVSTARQGEPIRDMARSGR